MRRPASAAPRKAPRSTLILSGSFRQQCATRKPARKCIINLAQPDGRRPVRAAAIAPAAVLVDRQPRKAAIWSKPVDTRDRSCSADPPRRSEMRDAVICEPVRTPIGRFGGALRDVPAHQLAMTAVRAVIERTGLGPADIDEVLLGQCYATAEAPAIGRVAALDAGLPVAGDRPATRPAMRLRPAGSHLRGDAGADRCQRPRPRGRRGEHELGGLLLNLDALGGAQRRRPAARHAGARPDHRGRQELPGAWRHARNRGEPAPRVPHFTRGAGRARAALPSAGGRRAALGDLRRGDRAGDR